MNPKGPGQGRTIGRRRDWRAAGDTGGRAVVHGKARIVARLIVGIIPDIVQMVVTYWPGPLGNLMRRFYWRRKLKHLGRHTVIDSGVHIVNPSCVSIGDYTHIDRFVSLVAGTGNLADRKIHHKANPAFDLQPGELHIGAYVHIAPFAYLLAAGGIKIGDRVGVAAGSKLFSISHHYCNPRDPTDTRLYVFGPLVPPEDQLLIVGPVVMEHNSALGLGSVVLPGSTIGENTWVATLSLVVGTIPPNVIAGGNPAVVVKKRPGTE